MEDDTSVAGFGGRRDWLVALGCALSVVVCVLAALPFAAMPFNDDFSYSFTARELARSGHLVYNGWASAALVPQAYWGALFIKLFGFSFTVTRLSTLPIAAAVGFVGYVLGRGCGLRRNFAALSSLTLGISPLFLPLAASFMTDAFGLLFALLALYGVIAAGHAKTNARAIGWVVLVVILALTGGTVRQIMWMTAIMGLPCVAWIRRRQRAIVMAALAGWICMVAGAWATLRWFDAQPYSIPEKPLSLAIAQLRHSPQVCLRNVWELLLTLTLWTMPAILASLPAVRRFRVWQWFIAAAVFGIILVARHEKLIGASAPWMGNTITATGVMDGLELSGPRPSILNGEVWALVSFATYAVVGLASALFLSVILAGGWVRRLQEISRERWVILTLTMFGLGYLALVIPRASYNRAYDRYVLPLYPCVTIPLLLICQQVGARKSDLRRWAALGWFVSATCALFGVGLTQELLGLSRARAAAAAELSAAGIPRTQIDAGFEYDSWTQLEEWGYLNDQRIVNPPGTFKSDLGPLPAVEPKYRVEFRGAKVPAGERETTFSGYTYFSYLPPFHRTLIIREIVVGNKIAQNRDDADREEK